MDISYLYSISYSCYMHSVIQQLKRTSTAYSHWMGCRKVRFHRSVYESNLPASVVCLHRCTGFFFCILVTIGHVNLRSRGRGIVKWPFQILGFLNVVVVINHCIFYRRATSMDLPMPMRFRHLKKTSKEAVGVYRQITTLFVNVDY